jgi:hypothetical protein
LSFKEAYTRIQIGIEALNLEHYVRNTLRVLKYGAGEEWRRSVGPAA